MFRLWYTVLVSLGVIDTTGLLEQESQQNCYKAEFSTYCGAVGMAESLKGSDGLLPGSVVESLRSCL